MPELVVLYAISEVGFHAGVNRGRMTLQALRLPKKVEPSPDNREQEVTMTVYGGTGKLP
jgi:hypothetical protein